MVIPPSYATDGARPNRPALPRLGLIELADQPIRRPRKNPLLAVFCFMLAVSPSSAAL